MAKHPLDTPRREAMCAWLTANGIDPNDVPEDGDLTIVTNPDGARVIAYEEYDRDAEGRIQVDERGTSAARIKRTTPLLVDPPQWWEPYEKPTRDDLLATLERVRGLAERWRYHQDRKNGPRQELLRALGEHAEPKDQP